MEQTGRKKESQRQRGTKGREGTQWNKGKQ